MGWKLVEVPEDDGPDILTDSELVGMSIFLANEGDWPAEEWNVYYRAWQKIQVYVNKAIQN